MAGNAWGLSRGERKLGLESDVLIAYDTYLKYPADKVIFTKNPQIFDIFKLSKEIFSILGKYDVYHFNYGSTLIDAPKLGINLLDLPLFKRYGKIVVTYSGCDARQKYPTIDRTPLSACQLDNCYNGVCMDGRQDNIRRKRIKKFDKYADGIFALNPDLLRFLPERAIFLPYVVAGWDRIYPLPYSAPTGKIKIVHAPTNRVAKGTHIIISVINRLQKEYKDRIELVLIENRSHDEALAIYKSADLVIDQILIGWYGSFAVEMMKLGKPVISFIREEDLSLISSEMANGCLKAVINVKPDILYKCLKDIIENPKLLIEYQRNAERYVNQWHNPEYVAGIAKKVYET